MSYEYGDDTASEAPESACAICSTGTGHYVCRTCQETEPDDRPACPYCGELADTMAQLDACCAAERKEDES